MLKTLLLTIGLAVACMAALIMHDDNSDDDWLDRDGK